MSRVDGLVSLQKTKVTNKLIITFDMPRFSCDLVALCTLVTAIERTDRNENPKSKVRQITSTRVMSMAEQSSTVREMQSLSLHSCKK